MYMIIVGAGSIGARLIDISVKEKNNVVVIESDQDRAKVISAQYDITVLNADATSGETLRESGAERADSLIATTNDDAVNLMVVSLAEELSIPSIISVVNDREHATFFRKLGANVMENPDDIVASHLYNAVKRPKVSNFAALWGGAQIFQAEIIEESPFVGLTIGDIVKQELVPQSALVVDIEREEGRQVPIDDVVLEAGDLITIYSSEHVTDELIDIPCG